MEKFRKQCHKTFFLDLTASNTQINLNLHSDQVLRHSIGNKYDFGSFFIFTLTKIPVQGKNEKIVFQLYCAQIQPKMIFFISKN